MSMTWLYTIVPLEVIFAPDEEDEECVPREEEQIVEVGGVRLLVRPDGMGGGTVTRVLSTDPLDFLEPRWEPGRKIRI